MTRGGEAGLELGAALVEAAPAGAVRVDRVAAGGTEEHEILVVDRHRGRPAECLLPVLAPDASVETRSLTARAAARAARDSLRGRRRAAASRRQPSSPRATRSGSPPSPRFPNGGRRRLSGPLSSRAPEGRHGACSGRTRRSVPVPGRRGGAFPSDQDGGDEEPEHSSSVGPKSGRLCADFVSTSDRTGGDPAGEVGSTSPAASREPSPAPERNRRARSSARAHHGERRSSRSSPSLAANAISRPSGDQSAHSSAPGARVRRFAVPPAPGRRRGPSRRSGPTRRRSACCPATTRA